MKRFILTLKKGLSYGQVLGKKVDLTNIEEGTYSEIVEYRQETGVAVFEVKKREPSDDLVFDFVYNDFKPSKVDENPPKFNSIK